MLATSETANSNKNGAPDVRAPLRICSGLLDGLRSYILASLQKTAGNLLLQSYYVDRVMLGQAADNRHLGAKHVALGHGRNDLLGRGFQAVEGCLQVDLGHGDDEF